MKKIVLSICMAALCSSLYSTITELNYIRMTETKQQEFKNKLTRIGSCIRTGGYPLAVHNTNFNNIVRTCLHDLNNSLNQ